MITEDYVSVETAKLLREKGFDEVCFKYALNSEIYNNGDFVISHKDDVEVGIPTLQMAMKWLREVHRIVITTDYANICGLGFTYAASVIKINNDGEIDDIDGPNICLYKDSYEAACETAIKYCLENLI